LPYLTMMFHSSELMPGCSKYRPDEQSIEDLYSLLTSFFNALIIMISINTYGRCQRHGNHRGLFLGEKLRMRLLGVKPMEEENSQDCFIGKVLNQTGHEVVVVDLAHKGRVRKQDEGIKVSR